MFVAATVTAALVRVDVNRNVNVTSDADTAVTAALRALLAENVETNVAVAVVVTEPKV
jgi:hypothetical protein